MKTRILLFFMAFFQVGLVAVNVIAITKGWIAMMLCTSFVVAMLWSFNIKKIALGSMTERLIYSFGAATGTLFGYFITHNL